MGYVIGAGDASPWVVGTDYPTHIYHYNNDSPPPRGWIQEANSANTSSLAVSPEGTPWKIDTSGYVSERTGPGTWASRGSSFLAWEVGVGRADNAWAVSRSGCTRDRNFVVIDCPVFQWASNQWIQHSGMGRHIAVAPDGTTYLTNSVGTIYKFNGSSFVQWGSGGARDKSHGDTLGWPVIAAASTDAVWVIGDAGSGADYPIYAWLPQTSSWQQIPGAATTISVGADGTPWVINSAKNIFEYVTSWQPMGPFGFSFVDANNVTNTWSGELHDVAIPTGGGSIVVGATGGGVWEHFFDWGPIADMGAGVNAQGQPRTPGPNMSIGSVAISPTDAQTVIVGTGVAGYLNNYTNAFGNGMWYTHNALTSPQIWAKASTNFGDPEYVTKIRYNSDGTKLIAATSLGVFIGAQDGNGVMSFTKAGASCQPIVANELTDVVTDPHSPDTFYVGAATEGVFQSQDGGTTCVVYVPGPLYSGGGAGTISAIALAMSGDSTLYASVAGTIFDQGGDDFQGIFATSAATLPNWTTPVYGGPGYPFLRSQLNHDWALATDPAGSTIIAAGVHPWRFTNCSPLTCANGADVGGGHGDVHSLLWGSDGVVYLVSDGGLFTSSDGGATWGSALNTVGVANEVHASVGDNGAIYASAWDVGLNYITNSQGAWQGAYANGRNFILDGHQAIIDPQQPNYVYACGSPGDRHQFDGTNWSPLDNPPLAPSAPCNFAISALPSNPLTIFGNAVYQYYGPPLGWSPFLTSLPGNAWSISRGNDSVATVWVSIIGSQPLTVSYTNGPGWQSAAVPAGWDGTYRIANGDGRVTSGAALALDGVTGDAYLVGENGSDVGALVSESTAASHGASWASLTGSGALAMNPNEIPNTIAVDSATRSAIVGTEGRAGSGIYRLNNPDVVECPLCTTTHHWRPWVYGLPNSSQPIEWLTGQYENGIYFYYAATWGRGIWKREARGGDF